MATDLSPYAGRWVALAGDKVAGVGDTADAAIRLARRNRPKERLALQYVEAPGGEPLSFPPLLDQIRPLLSQHEFPVHLVGGAVRDALLRRPVHDLDFVVPSRAVKLAFRVADSLGVPAYVLDQKRDTGRVVLPEREMTLDFARYRGADLMADLRDRDFTVNAMALPATAVTDAGLIDPCGGLADLQARRVQQTHPQAIARDPVRALRALRLAHSLNLALTSETKAAVAAAAPFLSQTAAERVRDELLKLLLVDQPHLAGRQMADLALLPQVLPEIAALKEAEQSPPHHEPVLAHTWSVLSWLVRVEAAIVAGEEVDEPALALAAAALADFRAPLQAHLARQVDGGVTGQALLRLGALFHDAGKRETQTTDEAGKIHFYGHDQAGQAIAGRRLRRLCFSNQAIEQVRGIVGGHMRPLMLANSGQAPSRRAVFRYFRATGDAGLDIGLLALADHLATYEKNWDSRSWTQLVDVVALLLRHYCDHYTDTVAPLPLIDGRDLMAALELAPGPEIGRLLLLVQEAQAAGEVATREEALALARRQHQAAD